VKTTPTMDETTKSKDARAPRKLTTSSLKSLVGFVTRTGIIAGAEADKVIVGIKADAVDMPFRAR